MEILHNPNTRKFFMIVAGREAYISYEKVGNALDLQYAFVPENLAKKGLGEKLIFAVFKYAWDKNIKIIPTCDLAKRFVKKNQKLTRFIKKG